MITIEELSAPYFEVAASWLSRPEINRWLTAEWRGRTTDTVMIRVMLRNRKNRVFLVRWHGDAVGLVALAEIDTTDSTAMAWYLLGESSLSGRGIISTAVRLMAQTCFQELKLECLYAWAMADNTSSIKVLQNAGFREAGRLRRAANSNGRQTDRLYFDLLPGDCEMI